MSSAQLASDPNEGIGRRDLVRSIAAMVGVSALGLGVARAAGLAGSEPSILVSCLAEDVTTLNPALSSATSALEAGSVVYNSLVWMDLEGKLQPDLAERWEISPAADTFTFYLRRGVTWHDGRPFTSADVQFTLGEMIAKFQPVGRGAYKYLASIETPDDHSVVVKMTQPYLPFMNVPFALGPILPKHLWEGTNFLRNPHSMRPVGTGPFMFKDYVSGDHVRFVRNPDYFTPGEPAFDEYIVRIIPDPAGRQNAFLNDEVDIILSTAVSPTDIARLGKLPNVELHFSSLSGGMFLGTINLKSEPYDDVRVRHALAHAIDRGFIRRHILPGISDPSIGPLWPASPLYNDKLTDYEFNPARANAILDAAGYARRGDGTRFKCRVLYIAADSRTAKMGEAISYYLGQVGIEVILSPLERGTLIQRGFIEGQFDMLVWGGSLGPDPDSGTERLYSSKNILPQPYVNNSGYANPAVDELFEQQRVQTSFASRKAIYDTIQEILWQDLPILPIATYRVPAIVHGDRVSGAFRSFSPLMDNQAQAKPLRLGGSSNVSGRRVDRYCASLPWPLSGASGGKRN